MTREAIRRAIAAVPFWHDPDEPPAETVGYINAEAILDTLEREGVVIFKTTPRERRGPQSAISRL